MAYQASLMPDTKGTAERPLSDRDFLMKQWSHFNNSFLKNAFATRILNDLHTTHGK